jgi:hypothetical protein
MNIARKLGIGQRRRKVNSKNLGMLYSQFGIEYSQLSEDDDLNLKNVIKKGPG